MRRAQRAASTVSTLQLVALGVFVLGGLVALAVLWAPQKPEAPPKADIAYQPRPAERTPPPAADAGPLRPLRRAASARTAAGREAGPADAAGASGLQIAGRVTDARSGEAVSGARIRVARQPGRAELEDLEQRQSAAREAGDDAALSKLRDERTQIEWYGETGAGADGAYRIAVGPPGDYRVEAFSQKYIPGEAAANGLGADKAEAAVDFALSTGATVAGRVTEAGSGRAAPDVVIVVEQRPDLRAVTDAQGAYELGGLAVGEYAVMADLSRSPYRASKVLPYRRVPVASAEAEVRNVDFQVEPAGLVWGYVQTPDRAPVRGAEVLLCTSDSPLTQALTAALNQAPPLRDRSQEDGYYELNGVPLNEEWRMAAQSRDHAPQLVDPFILTPQKREVRVDIYLFPGTSVSGRVVDPAGRPIDGAEVTCIPSYTELFSPLQSAQAFRNTRSDAEGYFTIEEIPAGSYQVFGRKRGYKFSAMGEPIYPDGYSPIENLTIRLEPVGAGDNRVFGVVADAGGRGLSGAEITVTGFGAETFDEVSESATSQGDGSFEVARLQAGSYRMRVTMAGYAPRSLGVRLNSPTNVSLTAAGAVRGQVLVRETNEAPQQFEVASLPVDAETGQPTFAGLMEQAGQTSGTTFSGTNGQFELFLPEGAYLLEGRAASYAPGRETITVASGQVTDGVVIYLSEAGGRIAGRVVTSDGKSPQGARVAAVDLAMGSEALVLMAAGGLPPNRMQTVGDESGQFEFTSLPAGEYVVYAVHEGYASGRSESIPLEERGNAEGIVVNLTAGGGIEGFARRRGQPVAGATIVAAGESAPKQTTTEADGSYRIDGLAPGRYQLTLLPIGGGDFGGINDLQSASVEVTEGQMTQYNFGDGSGAVVAGVCDPAPPAGLLSLPGIAALRPPGLPLGQLGEQVENPERLLSMEAQVATIAGGAGTFEIQDVPPGEWQLEILYPASGALGQYRYVHIEPVIVPEGEARIDLNINVSAAY